jgi:hypothetical protein
MIWERDSGLFERSLKERRCGRIVAQEEQRRGHLPPRVGFCSLSTWGQIEQVSRLGNYLCSSALE